MAAYGKNSGYGKRPLWQWIVIYAIIAAVVYGLVYYFVIAKKGNPYSSNSNSQQYSQTTSPATPAGSPINNSILMTKTDTAKGNYLTDTKGMTLYIFDKDTSNKSNCAGTCLTTWPPFKAPASSQTLPANIGVIKNADGSMQYTWKQMPLYYYAPDKQAGDIKGDGVGGVWHIVKP